MARVDHISDTEAPERTTAVFEAIREQFGMVPNFARTIGHSGILTDGFVGTQGELMQSGELGHELLEKVGVAVSSRNDCTYCVEAHSQSLLQNVNASQEEIEAIIGGRYEELPEREAVATAFAAAAAADPRDVDPARFERLRETFTDAEIVEIVGTAALFQGLNLFADALAVEPDG